MLGEGQSTSTSTANNNFSTNGNSTNNTTATTTDLNNGSNSYNNGGDSNATNGVNGSAAVVDVQKPKPVLDRVNQDIVRLIGQHLKLIGLDKSAETLMQESGCCLEHPGKLISSN